MVFYRMVVITKAIIETRRERLFKEYGSRPFYVMTKWEGVLKCPANYQNFLMRRI